MRSLSSCPLLSVPAFIIIPFFFRSLSLNFGSFSFCVCVLFFLQLVFRHCVLPWNPTTAPPCIFFVVEIKLFTILSIIDCILLPPFLLAFFFFTYSPLFSLILLFTPSFFFLLLETWGLYCTTCPSRWRLFDFFFSPPSLGFAKCASGSGQVWRLLCFDFFFCYSFVLCGQCRSRALTEHRGSDIMLALYFSTSI